MRLIFLSLTSFLIFTAFVMYNKPQSYHPSEAEQQVNKILSIAASIIKNKYDLNLCGVGASMPGGPIQRLTLCFTTKRPHTQDELRKLLIQCSQELLSQVDLNQDIQAFLKYRPFTIKNIHIEIYNHDRSGRTVHDPQISTADISRGVLTYLTIDPDDTFKYKNECTETYEEAVKLTSTQ